MREKSIIYVILMQIVIIAGISSIKAQWTESGVPVSISDGRQMRPFLAPDGLGGAIITWEDYRNGDDNIDIYAQRVDVDGYVKWSINGIAVCDTNDSQSFARIVSDGAGGAIIVWRDHRNGNYDIYAQRLNGNGTALWTTNGVGVCTAPADQHGPSITSDGNNGAIVAWKDFRDGHDDYYAQRIDSNGAPQWILNGVAISTIEVGYFEPINYPEIISDGSGGAIIAWADKRSGTDMIYAQRVDTDGNMLWTEDGVVVSDTLVRQSAYEIVSDSSGGAIITWKAERTDVTYHNDIYAQRIRSDGSIAWNIEGVPVCSSSAFGATSPALAESENGSAIITWYDMRTGDAHIYAQMVDSLGIVQLSTVV